MTQQFHEGQDVEVWCFPDGEWEKAKIVMETLPKTYQVQFLDGTRAVFDAGHIRAVRSDLQDSYDDCHQCGDVS